MRPCSAVACFTRFKNMPLSQASLHVASTCVRFVLKTVINVNCGNRLETLTVGDKGKRAPAGLSLLRILQASFKGYKTRKDFATKNSDQQLDSEKPAAEQTPAAPAAEQAPAAPAAEQTPAAPAAEQTPAAPAAEETPAAPAAEQTPAADGNQNQNAQAEAAEEAASDEKPAEQAPETEAAEASAESAEAAPAEEPVQAADEQTADDAKQE